MSPTEMYKFWETFTWSNRSNLEERIFGEVKFFILMPPKNTVTNGAKYDDEVCNNVWTCGAHSTQDGKLYSRKKI